MSKMWNSQLITGEPKKDEQHKQLFELVESYFDQCKKNNNKTGIVRVVKSPEKYVCEHFAYEERLQKKYNFPNYEDHKQLQDSLKETLANLKTKLRENKYSFSFC